jgi:hypothetical protein
MRQEHWARALGARRPIGQAPSGAPRVLPHPPAPCTGLPRRTTGGREPRPPTLVGPVGPRRRARWRPVEAPAGGDQAARWPRRAPASHPWRPRWAPPLWVTRRDARSEDARRAIRHGPDAAAPPPAGHTAPRALATPCWACAGRRACALALTQRARGRRARTGCPRPRGRSATGRWRPPSAQARKSHARPVCEGGASPVWRAQRARARPRPGEARARRSGSGSTSRARRSQGAGPWGRPGGGPPALAALVDQAETQGAVRHPGHAAGGDGGRRGLRTTARRRGALHDGLSVRCTQLATGRALRTGPCGAACWRLQKNSSSNTLGPWRLNPRSGTKPFDSTSELLCTCYNLRSRFVSLVDEFVFCLTAGRLSTISQNLEVGERMIGAVQEFSAPYCW